MATFAVVVDANVLIPAAPRDTLLRAAEVGLYRLHWSAEILDEVERNLITHGITDEVNARQLVDVLRRVFPEAMVKGYEAIVGELANHPKDRHVLAAAIHTGAQVIVTENLSDFPQEILAPHGIEAQSLDTFLEYLFLLAPDQMIQIIHEQAADLDNPPISVDDVLAHLTAIAPAFVQHIQERLP